MKKIILVFSVIIIAVLLSVSAFAVNGCEHNANCGDCNMDGTIDIKDAVLLAQSLAGWEVTLGSTVRDVGYSATCTEDGLSDGSHCKDCGEVFKEQVVIPATGHKIVIDPAVPPTDTENGLTEGKHCSVCGEIIVKQEIVRPQDANGLEYKVNSDGKSCTLTGIGTYSLPSLVFPNMIKGYTVTAIADNAFERTPITFVQFSSSIESIGTRAFYRCEGLTEVTIPENVTSLGTEIFTGCKNLKKAEFNADTSISGPLFGGTTLEKITFNGKYIPREICKDCTRLVNLTIGMGVERIYDSAFSGCSSLTDVKMPNSVKDIGWHVFEGCSNIAKITIPDGVTGIGNYSFMNCTKLASITIPDSIKAIGWDAFNGCTDLKSVKIPSIDFWCKIEFGNLSSNPLFNGADLYIDGKIAINLTIPDSVMSIGSYAFSGCTSLDDVKIPDSVTKIGDYSFAYCTHLPSINIPNSVTNIGDSAFRGCIGITRITIPDSITSITTSAFAYCTGLESIYIPDSVSNIGWNSFTGCTSLSGVTIPSSVTSIGGFAFAECIGLTSIEVPYGVISIEADAFADCINIADVTVSGSVTNIGECAFYNCKKLSTINYTGTKEKWKTVTKGSLWNSGTSGYTVHCTDGDLTKEES